jgi:methionyl-tRNA formyltransferase
VSPADTGQTLYRKLEAAAFDLFSRTWPDVSRGDISCRQQPTDIGTSHRTRDVERIDCIDLDRCYTGRELIDILRARTFPPYRGAYFMEGGRRIYLQLSLEQEP